MPISLNIEVKGARALKKKLDDLERGITNLQPFWRSYVSPRIKRELKFIFSQEGPGWPPLSPITIAMRRWPHYPKLVQTGKLKDRVINRADEDIRTNYYVRTIRDPRAHQHEHGRPERNLPARPFHGPALERSMDDIKKEHANFVKKEIRKVFRR